MESVTAATATDDEVVVEIININSTDDEAAKTEVQVERHKKRKHKHTRARETGVHHRSKKCKKRCKNKTEKTGNNSTMTVSNNPFSISISSSSCTGSISLPEEKLINLEAKAEAVRVQKMNRALFLMVCCRENRRLALQNNPNLKVGLVVKKRSAPTKLSSKQMKASFLTDSDLDILSALIDTIAPPNTVSSLFPLQNQLESSGVPEIEEVDNINDNHNTEVQDELESASSPDVVEEALLANNTSPASSSSATSSVMDTYRSMTRRRKSAASVSDAAWTYKCSFVQDVQSLNRVRLCRHKLEQWVHLPFFEEIVTGCYIRIGIGVSFTGNIYKICEILEVVEQASPYKLGSTFTNKALKGRSGGETNIYKMEYVSGRDFTWPEFVIWKESCEKARILPKLSTIQEKAEAIDTANNYRLTEFDAEHVNQQIERFKLPTAQPFLYYENTLPD